MLIQVVSLLDAYVSIALPTKPISTPLMAAVSYVLSHIKVQSKSKLVLAVLDYIKHSSLNVSNPEGSIYKVLQGLASLEAK